MTKTIEELRNFIDINQVEMAKKLNIPVSTYNVYENGRRTVPVEVVVKIAKILEVDVEEIFKPVSFIVCKPKYKEKGGLRNGR